VVNVHVQLQSVHAWTTEPLQAHFCAAEQRTNAITKQHWRLLSLQTDRNSLLGHDLSTTTSIHERHACMRACVRYKHGGWSFPYAFDVSPATTPYRGSIACTAWRGEGRKRWL